MKFATAEEKLKERVKELTCLYEISKIISKTNSDQEEFLNKIILSTKKAWRYSEDTIVEIQVRDKHYITAALLPETVCQSSYLYIDSDNIGFIKVHYPKNKYMQTHFLEDEQKLLDTISFEVSNHIEKIEKLEKEDLLRRSAERIDRLAILGEITAGIAHELNTPLGNILGFSELIKDSNTNPEIDSDISIIINSALYSREIVKKLLFFSCEMPHQLQLAEIKPIIHFVLSSLNQNFQKKEIKSNVVFKTENIIAKVDSVQLTQVLFNLLINAIYVSPQKSSIRIVVESDYKNVIIKIEDHGPGVPEDIKHKIFEPFFTTKPLNDGNGLGLSVVHGIIKKHKGEITIEDNQPTGAIFTIKIPLN